MDKIDTTYIITRARRLEKLAQRVKLLEAAHGHLERHGGPEHWTPTFEVYLKAETAIGAQEAGVIADEWLKKNWGELWGRILSDIEAEAGAIAKEFATLPPPTSAGDLP